MWNKHALCSVSPQSRKVTFCPLTQYTMLEILGCGAYGQMQEPEHRNTSTTREICALSSRFCAKTSTTLLRATIWWWISARFVQLQNRYIPLQMELFNSSTNDLQPLELFVARNANAGDIMQPVHHRCLLLRFFWFLLPTSHPSSLFRSPEILLGISYSHGIDVWGVGFLLASLYLVGQPLFWHLGDACTTKQQVVPVSWKCPLSADETRRPTFGSAWGPPAP